MSKIIPTLSKMWIKVTNLENSLFPQLQEKLIKILDFAEIEKNVCSTSKTNLPKDREQIALIRV